MSFKVRATPCSTCIYRKETRFDIKALEDQCKDKYGFFSSFRVCHHTDSVCCRGFWNRHKDEFAAGQIAQRLDLVEFVEEDKYPDKSEVPLDSGPIV